MNKTIDSRDEITVLSNLFEKHVTTDSALRLAKEILHGANENNEFDDFAKYVRTIIGKPDIVFRRKKIAVFIDSDFWHGLMPKSNRRYWLQKIQGNKERDRKINRELKKQGWTIIRIWEYDIKNNFEKSLQKILSAIEI